YQSTTRLAKGRGMQDLRDPKAEGLPAWRRHSGESFSRWVPGVVANVYNGLAGTGAMLPGFVYRSGFSTRWGWAPCSRPGLRAIARKSNGALSELATLHSRKMQRL